MKKRTCVLLANAHSGLVVGFVVVVLVWGCLFDGVFKQKISDLLRNSYVCIEMKDGLR